MKTQDLHVSDVDSIWTPVVISREFGLHLDSTHGHKPGTPIAPTRAVVPAFFMSSRVCGDNKQFSI
jgi:hypothetical protein